jgi:DNA replication protein DnaC
MNLIELQRALRQLRCSGMATGLEPRLLEAQTTPLAPIDFLSTLVQDELLRRQDRLLDRRITQAGFRDPGKTLDTFDFDFNKKMPRRLVFELATGRSVTARRRTVSRAARHGQEPLGASDRPRRDPARPSCALP